MKRIYQLFSLVAVAGLLTFTVNTADAQRGGRGGGGGGGGFHGGGGGGFSGGGGGRGGFGGGGGFQGGGNRGGQSFGGGFNRGGGQVQQAPRGNQSFGGGFNRGGVAQAPRGNQAFGGGFNRGGFNGAPNRGGFAYGNPGLRGSAYGRPGSTFAYRGGNYYRGGVGIRGGFGGPFLGGLYYHSGFYGRYYAPRIGFRLNILPYGYYPFYYGPDQYFYSSGYFYQYNNSEYTVVEPPLGAQVNSLPSNAQAINIDGQQYYESNGVYYLPVTLDDGSTAYQVVGKDGQLSTGVGQYQQQGDYQGDQGYPQQDNTYAPQNSQDLLQPGEVVQALPPNTRKVKIEGQVYHVDQAGVYYHEERDQSGRKVYRVTDISEDQQ